MEMSISRHDSWKGSALVDTLNVLHLKPTRINNLTFLFLSIHVTLILITFITTIKSFITFNFNIKVIFITTWLPLIFPVCYTIRYLTKTRISL
jgi:hypothetical protein